MESLLEGKKVSFLYKINKQKKVLILTVLITLLLIFYFSNLNFLFAKKYAAYIPDTILILNNSCNYDKNKGPRVLCTIFTTTSSHTNKMKAIHDTWSKR